MLFYQLAFATIRIVLNNGSHPLLEFAFILGFQAEERGGVAGVSTFRITQIVLSECVSSRHWKNSEFRACEHQDAINTVFPAPDRKPNMLAVDVLLAVFGVKAGSSKSAFGTHRIVPNCLFQN